jgi:hypothetical protein
VSRRKQQHLTLSSIRALAMNDITYQFTKTPPPLLQTGGFINYDLRLTGLSGTADVVSPTRSARDSRPASSVRTGSALRACSSIPARPMQHRRR